MELPIKKQYQIMDMIRQKIPERKIANKKHISPTTVQDYKKRGPPFYRKDPRGPPYNPPPASWLDERDWFIQTIKEQEQRVNYLTGENNRLINDNENLKKEKVTLEQILTQKDEQISQITKTHQEKLEQLAKPFDMLKEALPGLVAMRKENYDLKLKELKRKKDEDIAKIHSATRVTQPSPEDNHKPPQEPPLDEIDTKEENNTSFPWAIIPLAGLVSVSSFLKGYLEGKKNNSLSPPSQSVKPCNIPYSNLTNQKKNIIQPGIYGVGRGVGLGPGIGIWTVIPSSLKNYIRKT